MSVMKGCSFTWMTVTDSQYESANGIGNDIPKLALFWPCETLFVKIRLRFASQIYMPSVKEQLNTSWHCEYVFTPR
jgi:hypothetical protein